MGNVWIKDSAGLRDARSPGVRDELHTAASHRLCCCVIEGALVTCLRISTVHTCTVYPLTLIERVVIEMKLKCAV